MSWIYFDNAATSVLPFFVHRYGANKAYEKIGSVNRSNNELSGELNVLYSNARSKVSHLICSKKSSQIIFTKNTTDSIFTVASNFKNANVLVTQLDHNSNVFTWQTDNLFVCPVNEDLQIDLNVYEDMFKKHKIDIASFPHVSNVTGQRLHIEEMTAIAKRYGALVLIDGAQGIVYDKINVSKIDCDFYCFSAHKLYGPTGLGILWGKQELLEKMNPVCIGGGNYDNRELPFKFEYGTPPFRQALIFKYSIRWLKTKKKEKKIEPKLKDYLITRLKETFNDDIVILGKPDFPICTFYFKGIHSSDVAEALNKKEIAVREGKMCCNLLFSHLGLDSAIRASLNFLNSYEQIDKLIYELQFFLNFY